MDRAVTDHLKAANYQQAAASLRTMTPTLLDADRAKQAVFLIERCDRLAQDRRRLKQVFDDLTKDEEQIRQELLTLLDLPLKTEQALLSAERADEPRPRLAIWLLGSFRLAFDDTVVVGGKVDKSTPVLRFLAALGPAGIHKEQLAEQFWPETDPRTARRNLHQAIYTIRRLLGRVNAEAELVFSNDHYRLGSSPPWRDSEELALRVEDGRMARRTNQPDLAHLAFQKADLLYGGEMLTDHPFDEWVFPKREHCRALHREASAALLNHYRQANDHCAELQLAARLLALDPLDEDACRYLMCAHLALGQAHLAAMPFSTIVDGLRESRGVEPSAETQRIAEQLIAGSETR